MNDSYQFTPDHRLLVKDRRKLTSWKIDQGLTDKKERSFMQEQYAIFGGGRFAVVNKWGGHQILDPMSLEVMSEGRGKPRHYGRVPSKAIAAISSTHIAVYAESYGVLLVTQEETQVMQDWTSSFE